MITPFSPLLFTIETERLSSGNTTRSLGLIILTIAIRWMIGLVIVLILVLTSTSTITTTSAITSTSIESPSTPSTLALAWVKVESG